MKKMSRLALIALAITSIAPVALADLTTPKPRPHRKQKTVDSARLVITNEVFTQEAVLQIPRSTLKQIVAEFADEGESNLAAAAGGPNNLNARTIVAGIFLSLSFGFGGIWFFRFHRMGRKHGVAAIAGGLIICLIIGGLAATALADVREPGPVGGGGAALLNVIVAGFFLAASIAFGGIWLARYRRREGPKRKGVMIAVMMVVGLVAVLAVADLVFVVAADVRAPERFPLNAGTLPTAVANGASLSGEVRIRIVDEGDQITLTLPKPK